MKTRLFALNLVLVVLFLIMGCKATKSSSGGTTPATGNVASDPSDEAPITGSAGTGFSLVVPNERTNPVITYNGISIE